MTSETKHPILKGGKYIAERVFSIFSIKLYLWKVRFYEVFFEYCDNNILRVEQVDYDNILDLYIESMTRTGTPPISEWDKEENLSKMGKRVKTILEKEHVEFLNKLYWDEKLRWFCDIIEARAAYLIDEIQKKQKISFCHAKDIAVRQLLKDPVNTTKPPYIKYSNGRILYPLWYVNNMTAQDILIKAEYLYGDGVSQLLARLNDSCLWKENVGEDYWIQQIKTPQTKKWKKNNTK